MVPDPGQESLGSGLRWALTYGHNLVITLSPYLDLDLTAFSDSSKDGMAKDEAFLVTPQPESDFEIWCFGLILTGMSSIV